MSASNSASRHNPLDLAALVRSTLADEAGVSSLARELVERTQGSETWWAYQISPEDDVGLLLNPFSTTEKKIVLYPFRLTFRMFSQTAPTEHVRNTIHSILGPDYETKFGYPDTQWEENNMIFVESAVFNVNLKAAKGLGEDIIPMDEHAVKKMSPYKATCLNILFSRKLAEAVGVIQTDNIEPFHTYHPQPMEVITPVVTNALKVSAESVTMIVGRDEPLGLKPGVDYAPDNFFNLFLADQSWNKKLSALVKAMYWAHAKESVKEPAKA